MEQVSRSANDDGKWPRSCLPIMLAIGLMLVWVPPALAEMPPCPMTLDTLPMCITNHWQMGDILNRGVYNSLLAKANEAIAARDRGQIKTAINILHAFIDELSALRSKQITDTGVTHMIMHAQTAIEALQQML